jgi:flavin reductase (DIM6/NTAB) family NADH-FMN oxidoreductase RutF
MDAKAVSAVFGRLDKELWLVTSQADSRRSGLIATYVCRNSMAPAMPRVLIGLAKHHFTRELVEESSAFALHLLGDEHLPWVWQFGTQSGRVVDKFEGLEFTTAATGSPILSSALGWLDCRVEARLDAGDRLVFLAAVVEGELRSTRPLLTQKRLIQLAPPEMGRVLQEQYEDDCRLDSEQILVWREHCARQQERARSSD